MSFLTSALGGTLLGGLLSLITRVVDVFVKGKEADIEVKKATALASLKIQEEEMRAFTASQSAAADDKVAIPSNTPPWVSAVAVLVDAFRRFTRPGLTWALVAVVSGLVAVGKLPGYTLELLAADLVFCMSTALTWWFGSRAPVRKTKA